MRIASYQTKKQRLFRGFTLIELLVVVSIIALLVSILLPALGKARETAKKTLCMTQLNQISMGYVYYMNDWDGFYRPGYIVDPSTLNPGSILTCWVKWIWPYMDTVVYNGDDPEWWKKLPEVFLCPSDMIGKKNFNTGKSGAGAIGDYSMNVFVSSYKRYSTFRNPGGTIFFYESMSSGHGYPGSGNPVVERHSDTSNYLYMDMHVETDHDPGPDYTGPGTLKAGWEVFPK